MVENKPEKKNGPGNKKSEDCFERRDASASPHFTKSVIYSTESPHIPPD